MKQVKKTPFFIPATSSSACRGEPEHTEERAEEDGGSDHHDIDLLRREYGINSWNEALEQIFSFKGSKRRILPIPHAHTAVEMMDLLQIATVN